MNHPLEEGDRVRIDIPDETDPDHTTLHGRPGVIVEIQNDEAGEVTGDPRDALLYSIRLDDGTETNVRWRDIRPP